MKAATYVLDVERAREAARVFLTPFVKYFKPLVWSAGSLESGFAWKTDALRELVHQAPTDPFAWGQCTMALLYLDPADPAFTVVRQLGARAMRGEVKRPAQRRKYAVRDAVIGSAVQIAMAEVALEATRNPKSHTTSACDVVADALNELGVRDAKGGEFTYEAVEGIWRRRRR